MTKRINKNKLLIVIIVIAIIFSIMIVIFNILNNKSKIEIKEESRSNVIVTSEKIEENKRNTELEKIKKMTERNRIEYYVKEFISYLTDEEYEEAYDLLNEDFRKDYFPTESDFRKYINGIFTKMVDVNFTNFERNGDIYVCWVTITDAINGTKDSGIEFNFVVQENDYNDFELSFSKKSDNN